MFRNLPPITKNLLLINLICYLADVVFQRYGISFSHVFGLHYLTASDFRLWQPLTYMFMHANFSHIFFNMFAVLMFAPALEDRWGGKRFLIYYLVTGLGAAVVQEAVWALQLQPVLSSLDPMMAAKLANRVVTIGASGAVFGILLAFGWLFPDVRMFIMFIPIPIRARTLVIIYALIELFTGLAPTAGDRWRPSDTLPETTAPIVFGPCTWTKTRETGRRNARDPSVPSPPSHTRSGGSS